MFPPLLAFLGKLEELLSKQYFLPSIHISARRSFLLSRSLYAIEWRSLARRSFPSPCCYFPFSDRIDRREKNGASARAMETSRHFFLCVSCA